MPSQKLQLRCRVAGTSRVAGTKGASRLRLLADLYPNILVWLPIAEREGGLWLLPVFQAASQCGSWLAISIDHGRAAAHFAF
jgi:hypothetical protein